MLHLSFVTTIIFIAFVVLSTYVWIGKAGRSGESIKNWLFFVDGAVMIAVVFFFQPWIKFEFISNALDLPAAIKEFLSADVIRLLVGLLKQHSLDKLIHFVTKLMSLNGIYSLFIPMLSWFTRLVIVFPLASVFPVLISAYFIKNMARPTFKKIFFGSIMVISALMILCILITIPNLARLSSTNYYGNGLAGALLGSEIGNAPYWTMVGLILWIIGAGIEFQKEGEVNPEDNLISEGEYA